MSVHPKSLVTMTDKPAQIPFKIKGDFEPAGDQPAAIAKLV